MRPAPIADRIAFAEAVIELAWTRVKELPPARTGIIEKARWQHAHDTLMEPVDRALDQLSLMYAERDGITIPDVLTDAF